MAQLEALEAAEGVIAEVVQRGAQILYSHYIESKLDTHSIENALTAIELTVEGGFIQHDAGELLAQERDTLEIEEDDSEDGLAQAKDGIFEPEDHEWLPNPEPEPPKIDSKARMALRSERINVLLPDQTGERFVPPHKLTMSHTSSQKAHRSTLAATGGGKASGASGWKVNAIRIEQDELIEEDEQVQMLREWKLAQLRESEEEERRRQQREAEEKKSRERQRKLMDLMKRQTITYDSTGGVLGVKRPLLSSPPKKTLAFQMEKPQKPPKPSARRTEPAVIDESAGRRVSMMEEDYFIADRPFAGSNFSTLQPNYGVQIREQERVKSGSFAFKELFNVMSRAEYEAQFAVSCSHLQPQLIGKKFVHTLAQQTSQLHLTQMAVPKGPLQEYSTIQEETPPRLEGSIRNEMQQDLDQLRVDLPAPDFKLATDKYSTLPGSSVKKPKDRERSMDEYDATLREPLPHFMKSTLTTQGVGKSPSLPSLGIGKQNAPFKVQVSNPMESTFLQKKPRKKAVTEFSKLLKQASEPHLGRTTFFFQEEALRKSQKLIVHQKGMSRDRSQPNLVAKALRPKKMVVLPPLPPPPVGRTFGHGVVNDITRISQL